MKTNQAAPASFELSDGQGSENSFTTEKPLHLISKAHKQIHKRRALPSCQGKASPQVLKSSLAACLTNLEGDPTEHSLGIIRSATHQRVLLGSASRTSTLSHHFRGEKTRSACLDQLPKDIPQCESPLISPYPLRHKRQFPCAELSRNRVNVRSCQPPFSATSPSRASAVT